MRAFRIPLLLALSASLLAAAGCSEDDASPLYCDNVTPCPAGMKCNFAATTCVSSSAADAGGDAAVKPDSAGDATTKKDLAAKDMAGVDAAGDLAVDLKAPDAMLPDLAAAGVACKSAAQCRSGSCADGYCCDKACSGVCEACDLGGTVGTCTFVASGQDPDAECSGEAACGGDVCDGKGACTAFLAAATVCKSACSSVTPTSLEQNFCDGKGTCDLKGIAKSCVPYLCQASSGGAACTTTCKTHADCATGSLCDRTAAHKTGLGACVDLSKVETAATSKELTDAVAKVNAGTLAKTHILLSGTSPYTVNLSLTAGSVTLVGAGSKSVLTPVTGAKTPVITVGAGATLNLQGVTVNKSAADGVKCLGGTTQGTLGIFESSIESNTGLGVSAGYCDVTLRRCGLRKNAGGGAKLLEGDFTVVNNLVIDNGDESAISGSGVGGFLIFGTSGTVTFTNNTVADNVAKTLGWTGMQCTAVSEKLTNNIVWHSKLTPKDAITTGCSFEYSDVQGLSGGSGNLNTDPLFDANFSLKASPTASPCIDAGTATTATVIDLLGNPRPAVSGGKVDMGAMEVK